MGVFISFAIITLMETSVALVNVTAGHGLNTITETRMFESAWCITSVLYVLAYIAYANILQSVWAYKHTHLYFDPILAEHVQLPVYIRNR